MDVQVTPGERLAPAVSIARHIGHVGCQTQECQGAHAPLHATLQAEYEAGVGTFTKGSFICSSLVGLKRVLPADPGSEEVSRLAVQPWVGPGFDTAAPNTRTHTPRSGPSRRSRWWR